MLFEKLIFRDSNAIILTIEDTQLLRHYCSRENKPAANQEQKGTRRIGIRASASVSGSAAATTIGFLTVSGAADEEDAEDVHN